MMSVTSSYNEKALLNINDLSPSLVMLILSNLPLESLFNCRLVCKTWRYLISQPYFHDLSKNGSTVIIHRVKSALVPPEQVEVEKLTSVYQCYNVLGDIDFVAMNSCHGLVCVRERVDKNYCIYVFNLVFGEFVKLGVNVNSEGRYSFFGIGYSGNDYKVLQLIKPMVDGEPIDAYVYTLGDGTWRCIGESPFRPLSQCTYLNGALHWITSDAKSYKFKFIGTFDVGKEVFRSISLPSNERNRICFGNLGVVDHSLFVTARDVVGFRPDVQIWVMEKYGVKESWVKKFCVKDPMVEWWNLESEVELLQVSQSGEIFLLCGKRAFCIYNLASHSFSWLLNSKTKVSAHVPGFVSLKHVIPDGNGVQGLKVKWYPVDSKNND